MAEIEIRSAVSTDIPQLTKIDHTIETSYIWQVVLTKDDKEMNIHLLQTKLPRPMILSYPKRINEMANNWNKYSLFLTARLNDKLVGYLTLSVDSDTLTAQIADLVVDIAAREKGIASGLFITVLNNLKNTGIRSLTLAVPIRNEAGVGFAQKLNMEFSGYIDHYFMNHDAALIFSTAIK
jgi:ribosomal protein S18 acetylase RimI-like enzyme